MDSRKLKKFIAKEGLIILGTIGLGFFFQTLGMNFLPSLQVAIQQSHGRFIPDSSAVPTNDGPWSKYQQNGGGDATTTQQPQTSGKFTYLDGGNTTTQTQLPSDAIANPNIQSSSNLPSDAIPLYPQQPLRQNPFNKVMIYLGQLLVICYPISWIIRFIVWAVRTLKRKD